MKLAVLSALAALALAAPAYPEAPAKIPPYITKAIAARDRGDQAATDLRRHPAEILALSGVKPGDTVAELIPGSGYFTRLFSKIVGPTGHVYAIWPAEYDKVSHPDSDNLIALQNQGLWQHYGYYPAGGVVLDPMPVNLVFTSQNYHDYPDKFMGPTDPLLLDKGVFNALKRGGHFMVIDHMAAPGSGERDTDTLHRIDLATVKAQVVGSGFNYVGATAVLRNPSDDHTKPVFDPSVRGHTDQFALLFRRPL